MGVGVNGFYFTAILDRLCREFERMAVKCSLVPRRCQRDEHASAAWSRPLGTCTFGLAGRDPGPERQWFEL